MNKNKQLDKKKFLVALVVGIFALALVNGAVLSFFGQVQQNVTVTPSILINGEEGFEFLETSSIENGNEQKLTSDAYIITNDGSRDLALDIDSTADPDITVTHDSVGLSTDWSGDSEANADASLNVNVVTLVAEKNDGSTASEGRITIAAEDVADLIGVTGDLTLGDLDTISWNIANVVGYEPHIDIILADDIDGLENRDSITAEQAYNTDDWISNSVSIDDSTTFWVTRLGAGINDAPFGTLAELKAGDVTSPDSSDPDVTISSATKIASFEIEVDAWVSDSSVDISNIEINTEPKEITNLANPVVVDSGSSQTFYVNKIFDELLGTGDYIIETTVNPSA